MTQIYTTSGSFRYQMGFPLFTSAKIERCSYVLLYLVSFRFNGLHEHLKILDQ